MHLFSFESKTCLSGHMICFKYPESINMITSLPEMIELIFFDEDVKHCPYIMYWETWCFPWQKCRKTAFHQFPIAPGSLLIPLGLWLCPAFLLLWTTLWPSVHSTRDRVLLQNYNVWYSPSDRRSRGHGRSTFFLECLCGLNRFQHFHSSQGSVKSFFFFKPETQGLPTCVRATHSLL